MFILFGWGHTRQQTVGPVQEHKCEVCQHEKYWLLHKVSHWFTLFFVPVIPYRTEYVTFCPVCRNAKVLSRDQFEELKPLASLNQEAVNNNMTEEEYQTRVNQL